MADIRNNFVGIKSPNPFWLASAPPTDKAYNVVRAFKAGRGGGNCSGEAREGAMPARCACGWRSSSASRLRYAGALPCGCGARTTASEPLAVAADRCHRSRQVYSGARGLGLSQSVAEPGPGDGDVIQDADANLDPSLYWIRKLLKRRSESSTGTTSATKHGIVGHSRRAATVIRPTAAS